MLANNLKRLIACVLCLVVMTSLCACSPYIDQNFIDLNMTAQQKPTEKPTEPEETTPIISTEPEETPEESKPAFKPGGFTLADDEPVQNETEPIIDDENTNDGESGGEDEKPTPKPPSGTQIGDVRVSAGLKSALNHVGRTTTTQATAFQPSAGSDGGQTIILIRNNGNQTATQYTYMYYESTADYETASAGVSPEACNAALRLILRGETETLPVTNPETLSFVLFDGYVLWR
jgi:hypothetical protein